MIRVRRFECWTINSNKKRYHHFAKYQLFPMIAEFYAVILGGLRVKALVEENFEKVVKHEDFSMMGLTHAILSGCKANYTQFVVHAAEWSRLSCGGHGFAHYSGLPAIYKENSPNVTLEGENTVMYLQLVRFMLKQLRNQLGGSKKPVSPYFDFVKV
jgi:acyl-CoA oxidase